MDRSLARRFGSVLLAVCMAMAMWQPAPAYAARNKILNIAAKSQTPLIPTPVLSDRRRPLSDFSTAFNPVCYSKWQSHHGGSRA